MDEDMPPICIPVVPQILIIHSYNWTSDRHMRLFAGRHNLMSIPQDEGLKVLRKPIRADDAAFVETREVAATDEDTHEW
jgi:hypothetical protein